MAGMVWRVHRYLPALSGVMQRAIHGDLASIRQETLAAGSPARPG
jgi:hypothetical protein